MRKEGGKVHEEDARKEDNGEQGGSTKDNTHIWDIDEGQLTRGLIH